MSSEQTDTIPIGRRIIHFIPTVITFSLLAGVAWWGHATGWRLAKPSAVATSQDLAHWCNEHHVPEDGCLLCKKRLGKAQAEKEPAHLKKPGEETLFAQVASAEALIKTGIATESVVVAELAPRLRVAAETVYAPHAVARLGSRVSGSLRLFTKQIGDQVSTGEVIALVESSDVGHAKSTFMQAWSDKIATTAVLNRMQASADSGFRTQAEVDEAAALARAASISVFNAEQNLRNLGFTLPDRDFATLTPADMVAALNRLGLPDAFPAQESANLLPVRSPLSGILTDVHVVVGEQITPDKPLAIIADPTELWLRMSLSSDRAARLKKGQSINFEPSDGSAAIPGTLIVIPQAADPITRLVTAWARLENAEDMVRVHQFGNARITLGMPIMAATIPTSAIQFDGVQAYVFVQRTPTIFRSLPVDILARDGNRVAVSRLMENDVVAVSNTIVLFASTFPERMGAGCTDD